LKTPDNPDKVKNLFSIKMNFMRKMIFYVPEKLAQKIAKARWT